MTRRSYAGGAVKAALTSSVDENASSLPVDNLEGWPDGLSGPFSLVVDKGGTNEEKMLGSSASGTSITIAVRGYDGTTPKMHSANESVQHAYTSVDADEANAHVNSTSGVHGLNQGDPVVGEQTPATLRGKIISGLDNQIIDLDSSAFPDIDIRLDAIEAKNVEQDTALALRYTKTESDARYVLASGQTGTTGTIPTGGVTAFAGSVAPDGWLLCNGQAVSRTTYAALFAVIGTLYGGGNGTTTFQVPDLTGRMPVGQAAGISEFAALGQSGGARSKTLTVTEMPAHDHSPGTNYAGQHSHTGVTGTTNAGTYVTGMSYRSDLLAGGGTSAYAGATTGSANHNHTVPVEQAHQHTVTSQGGGSAFSTLPPYLAVNFLIKT